MTQKQFWFLAIACNLLLLFLYVFKQNALMALGQTIQKKEEEVAALHHQKKELYNKLQQTQQHASIKKRAEKELGMRKADLKQISSLETPACPPA